MAPEINDLPMQNYERYAKDQEALAQGPRVKEDRFIGGPAQVDVNEPSYPSAVTSLVGQDQTNVQWALFQPPTIMGARRTDLFKEDLVPSLGNMQDLEVLKKRLESTPETLHGQ